tara:strand:- start:4323 stop:4475 length:153 start_codon:yes stop_codon:yes gene_type:complete
MTIELKLIIAFVFLLTTLLLFGEEVNWFFHSGESVWEEMKDVQWKDIKGN